MVYNKKTQRKRSKSASKSRARRGGDIEDGKPADNVAQLMKPPSRSVSPTNVPQSTYDQTMKSRAQSSLLFDSADAAEKGEAGPNLVGGKRRKGRKGTRKSARKSARKGRRSTRRHKKSTKKKSLFGKLFGL
jgi:hypothetical protein|tara:strand:+ start:2413 stop:2808 length:396 start_codon:yes stop_codon:yes gene_type:complete